MRGGNFVREKTIHCGENFKVVEIFPWSDAQESGAGRPHGSTRVTETNPAQRNLNDKHSRQKLDQLIMTNFYKGDYKVELSYKPEFRPATIEDAMREFENFIRRVSDREKKQGLPKGKYIHVLEYTDRDGADIPLHHHVLLSTKLTRDEVEDLWSKGRGKNRGRIGRVHCEYIEPDLIVTLAEYLTKSKIDYDTDEDGNPIEKRRGRVPHKRRWSGSHNLERPYSTHNDHAYSRRKLDNIAKQDDPAFWRRKYPDWRVIGTPQSFYNEITAEWHIRLKLRKR